MLDVGSCPRSLMLARVFPSSSLCGRSPLPSGTHLGERGSQGSGYHSQSPLDVSVHSRETCLPCTASNSSRGSTHTTMARGTALWESLVGKPRGKATEPLIHAKGSVTLLQKLGGKHTCMTPPERRTDSPGETQVVPQDPCQHWRGILRFGHRLHTRS